MIKQIKKINANIKDIIETKPKLKLSCLNSKIPFNSGKNKNVINPIAAPIPCIFEAIVIIFLLSFTWNIAETNPAPTAKVLIESNSKTDRIGKSILTVRK